MTGGETNIMFRNFFNRSRASAQVYDFNADQGISHEYTDNLESAHESKVCGTCAQHVANPSSSSSSSFPYTSKISTSRSERQKYQLYMAGKVSIKTLIVLALAASIGFASPLISSMQSGRLALMAVYTCRWLSVVPIYIYAWLEYRACGGESQPQPTSESLPGERKRTTMPATWLANFILVYWALVGAVVVTSRVMVGRCDGKSGLGSVCNNSDISGSLPAGSVIVNLMTPCALSLVLKTQDAIYAYASGCITIASILILMCTFNLFVDSVAFIGAAICVNLWLYEYERSTQGIYSSHCETREYYEKNIEAAKLHKSVQDYSEQLSVVMGNVSHDLKTPLQSFMSEISILSHTLDKVWPIVLDPTINPGPEMLALKQQTCSVLVNLENVYSFMMIAIKRGEDFRKFTAGIALQPVIESFPIADAGGWAVERMGGTPTGVQLRIIDAHEQVRTRQLCPCIKTDRHWFCENILSLASNALKFTSAGSVEVEYRLAALIDRNATDPLPVVVHDTLDLIFTPPPPIPAPVTAVDGVEANLPAPQPALFVLVLVRDTGIGIALEKKKLLFQSFSQVHESTKGTGGTGLGLFSISKRMEALGGHCGVQDREDGATGSCFWLAYPYAPDWNAALSPSQTESIIASRASGETSTAAAAYSSLFSQEHVAVDQAATGSILETIRLSIGAKHQRGEVLPYSVDDPFWETVLLVEDSPMILKTVTRLLQNEGFTVDIAQNGAIGLEKMQKKPYLVVVSDIQMPILDGCEMTRRLREHEAREREALCGAERMRDPASPAAADGTLVLLAEEEDIETGPVRPEVPVPVPVVQVEVGADQDQAATVMMETKSQHHMRRLWTQFIVGMSANSDARTQEAAIGSGMNCFLAKPVMKKELKARIVQEYNL